MRESVVASRGAFAQIKRWPTRRSKEWLSAFIDQFATDGDVLAIVAVGSAVRPNVRSVDLDIIVICKEPARLLVRAPLEVDLRTYGADALEREIAAGGDLLGWAIRFGKVLFERDSFWSDLVEQFEGRLPLPSPDVARRRASESLNRLQKVLELGDLDAAEEQALSLATHLARAELLERGVYPASRPELPGQLRQIGRDELADRFEQLMDPRANHSQQVAALVRSQRVASDSRLPGSSEPRGRVQ